LRAFVKTLVPSSQRLQHFWLYQGTLKNEVLVKNDSWFPVVYAVEILSWSADQGTHVVVYETLTCQ